MFLLHLKGERGPRCLVYGLGMGEEISFDEEFARKYGCEVHAYDLGPHPKVERRHQGGRRGVHVHKKYVGTERVRAL